MDFQFDAEGLDFYGIPSEDTLLPPLKEEKSRKRAAEEVSLGTSSPTPVEPSLSVSLLP